MYAGCMLKLNPETAKYSPVTKLNAIAKQALFDELKMHVCTYITFT